MTTGSSKTQAIDKAARLVRDGKLPAALKEYQQLFAGDPADLTVGNALGDLYLKMGRIDEGVTHLIELAEQVAEQGHTAKARAVYRKVLRVQPHNKAAASRVNELEASHLDSSPVMRRILGAFRDSQPAPAPLKVASAAPIEKAPALKPIPVAPLRPDAPAPVPAAFAEFLPTPDDWIMTGRRLAEAHLQKGPTSPRTRQQIADAQRVQTSALQVAMKGDFRAAADMIEQFLTQHPHDVDALEALVDFAVEARLDGIASIQIRLATACLETGRHAQARDVAVDLLARYPADTRVHSLIDRVSRLPVVRPEEPAAEAPLTVVEKPAGDGLELFDDHGLVTGGARREASSTPRRADNLDEFLDESGTRDAIDTATRLAAEGDFDGAAATLAPFMDMPDLRPLIGVHLAQFYRAANDCAAALECLEQAAEQPALDEENEHALAYEVALTLQAMGHRQEALAVYRELLSEVGPAFRDVAARAEELSAA